MHHHPPYKNNTMKECFLSSYHASCHGALMGAGSFKAFWDEMFQDKMSTSHPPPHPRRDIPHILGQGCSGMRRQPTECI
jgi:hypothetical protein